jgi:hypothetical protein
MGEDSVRATRPHPSEQQDRHAERASCQKKCEKFGLVTHPPVYSLPGELGINLATRILLAHPAFQ